MIKSSLVCVLSLLFLSACSDDATAVKVLYPDQQSADFKQFASQCSACHRPPMPNTLSAELWLSTVGRMQMHRQKRGLSMMTTTQQQQVLAYLQRHAQQDVQ